MVFTNIMTPYRYNAISKQLADFSLAEYYGKSTRKIKIQLARGSPVNEYYNKIIWVNNID